MTLAEKSPERAFIDSDGAIVPLGDALPAVTLEDAERWLPAALDTIARLKRLTGFLEDTIREGWQARGQREGLLDGLRFVLSARPTPWAYDSQGLFDSLLPFVGKVITQDELIEATGWNVVPERTEVIPEHVVYDVQTAKVDALCRRSKELAEAVAMKRSRESGVDRLSRK